MDNFTKRRKGSPRFWLVLFPLMFAVAVSVAARPGDLTDALMAVEGAVIRAYVTRDTPALARILADEYVHTNFIGQRETKAEEIAEFGPGGAFTLQAATIDHGVARRYGNIAILCADVHWIEATYRPAGRAAIDVSGDYSVSRVYIWRAGRWQLLSSHASRLPRQPSDTDHPLF